MPRVTARDNRNQGWVPISVPHFFGTPRLTSMRLGPCSSLRSFADLTWDVGVVVADDARGSPGRKGKKYASPKQVLPHAKPAIGPRT